MEKLKMQGEFLKLLKEEENCITWQSFIHQVPKGVMGFALRAVSNSLNTPDNLKRWGVKKSANCSLCKNKNTNLQHLLQWCPTSLKQGRFTWRHNSVLNYLVKIMKENNDESEQIFADLPGHQINGGTVPANVLVTVERPDIVIIETVTKKVTILELTVSFETNIEAANMRKQVKYNDLKQDINKNGYITEIIPFEIGSRGHITKRNREALKKILKQKKETAKKCIDNLAKISLLCSFTIFKASSVKEWNDPPLLHP